MMYFYMFPRDHDKKRPKVVRSPSQQVYGTILGLLAVGTLWIVWPTTPEKVWPDTVEPIAPVAKQSVNVSPDEIARIRGVIQTLLHKPEVVEVAEVTEVTVNRFGASGGFIGAMTHAVSVGAKSVVGVKQLKQSSGSKESKPPAPKQPKIQKVTSKVINGSAALDPDNQNRLNN